MALDHGKIVLSGILPDRRDLLVDVMRWLEPEHFANQVQRDLWKVITWFYSISGGVLTRKFIADASVKADTARLTLMGELYDQCATARYVDAEIKASVRILRELRAEHLTAEAITRSMELLTRGGEIEGKEVDPGSKTAWEFLLSEHSRIEHLGSLDAAPEGDVLREPSEGIADYAARKKAMLEPGGIGVTTGLRVIDRVIGGFQPGEFVLIVGYTGAGKSMLCTQTAWHVATQQRKNVFYATSETTREMTRRRIYARHSRLPKFGTPEGLNSNDLKMGKLSTEQEKVLQAVVADLDEGARAGTYGRLHVAQVPPDATWSFVAADARRISAQWPIDLVVVDYLALLRADRRRDNQVHEYTDMMKSVKTFATSFDDGKGVTVMSPWSVNQEAFRKAQTDLMYTLASLSDTSEAEKSPDVLLWMLPPSDEPNRVVLGFLKNRDGELTASSRVVTDYRSTYLGDLKEQPGVDELINPVWGSEAKV